jgi:hypothetical protein
MTAPRAPSSTTEENTAVPAQFLRIETYALRPAGGRWSVAQVLNEAYRIAGDCPHVAAPDARVLEGPASPGPILAACEEVAGRARDARGRRARGSTPILLSAVASYPDALSGADEEARGRMALWRDRVVQTWREWWGRQMVAVVEHWDEARYHLHGLVVAPLRAGRVAMAEIFPAVAARQTARETGQSKRLQDRAYKTGLRALQDAFHAAVSAHVGHARLGPQRQRLTRQEWRARRAEEERLAARARCLDERERAMREMDAYAALAAAEGARRRAEDAEERARRAEERAAAAEAEAARGREALALLERARRAADEIEALGGWRASRTPAEREARVIDRLRALSAAR